MLKALLGFNLIYIRHFFEENNIISNLCSTVYLKQLKCDTVIYDLNSCYNKCAEIWNDLTNEIKITIILGEFKHQI